MDVYHRLAGRLQELFADVIQAHERTSGGGDAADTKLLLALRRYGARFRSAPVLASMVADLEAAEARRAEEEQELFAPVKEGLDEAEAVARASRPGRQYPPDPRSRARSVAHDLVGDFGDEAPPEIRPWLEREAKWTAWLDARDDQDTGCPTTGWRMLQKVVESSCVQMAAVDRGIGSGPYLVRLYDTVIFGTWRTYRRSAVATPQGQREIAFAHLQAFHDHVLDRLEGGAVGGYQVKRYAKWASTWQWERLEALASQKGSHGDERALRDDFASFLFERGLDPVAEWILGPGRADVGHGLGGPTETVIEVKVVRDGDGDAEAEERLRRGAEQARDYARRLGHDVAHLLVFWFSTRPLPDPGAVAGKGHPRVEVHYVAARTDHRAAASPDPEGRASEPPQITNPPSTSTTRPVK